MTIRYIVALAAIMCITHQTQALKLMSPEAVCMQRGLKENSPEWDACIQETTENNDRTTREFYADIEGKQTTQTEATRPVAPQQKSAYDIDNKYLVPPLMQKALSKKLLYAPKQK